MHFHRVASDQSKDRLPKKVPPRAQHLNLKIIDDGLTKLVETFFCGYSIVYVIEEGERDA